MLLILLGLGGCAGLHSEPLIYTNIDDMRPGPGLFTGPEGAFVLFRSDKSRLDPN